jgi:hypothetical protein
MFNMPCVYAVHTVRFSGGHLDTEQYAQHTLCPLHTAPCRLSATAYSKYLQLPSISAGRSSIHNLSTRHAVVTGTHLSRLDFLAFMHSQRLKLISLGFAAIQGLSKMLEKFCSQFFLSQNDIPHKHMIGNGWFLSLIEILQSKTSTLKT